MKSAASLSLSCVAFLIVILRLISDINKLYLREAKESIPCTNTGLPDLQHYFESGIEIIKCFDFFYSKENEETVSK